MNHRYPACPIDCDLYSVIVETGAYVDYAQAIVNAWSLPPYLEVFTEDKNLDGRAFPMVIQCRIDPSAANPVVENSFTVTLRDECYDTVISPLASLASYEIDLFFPDERLFSPAG